MSAKPQPMAGQSDAADDLIAELAKLMANDAKVDRPAEAPSPSFSVRIPGGDAPVPRFDFERTVALAAERPADPPSAPVPPKPAALDDDAPAPVSFDFGFEAPKPAPAAEPAPAAAPAADFDSIADLIAADLTPTAPP